MATDEHHTGGHQCPPFALDEEECELIGRPDEYGYENYSDYQDPKDATFWVPHQ